jgi:hypothetical protein
VALHGGVFLLALAWVAKRHLNISLRCAVRSWLRPAGESEAGGAA